MWKEQDTLFWDQIKQRYILLLIFIHNQIKISSLLGESQLEHTFPTGKTMRREKDEDSGGLLKLTSATWNNHFQIKCNGCPHSLPKRPLFQCTSILCILWIRNI